MTGSGGIAADGTIRVPANTTPRDAGRERRMASLVAEGVGSASCGYVYTRSSRARMAASRRSFGLDSRRKYRLPLSAIRERRLKDWLTWKAAAAQATHPLYKPGSSIPESQL